MTIDDMLREEHVLMLGKLRKAYSEKNKGNFQVCYELYTGVVNTLRRYDIFVTPSIKEEVENMKLILEKLQ